MHSVYMVIIPFLVLFQLEVVVACIDYVGWDVGVEMVDVVVFNSICEGAQQQGDLEEGAALEGSTREVPTFLAFSIGQVDRVLQMEQNGSQNLSNYDRYPHFQSRDSEQWTDPSVDDYRHQLLQKCETEDPISLWHGEHKSHKPHQRRGKEEENNWLPQNSSSNPLDSLHFLVLFLGKENGLREIQSIQVPKMLMMMIMPVPPRVKRKVRVDAYQFAKEDVGFDGLKEGEMSHVVKLDEESNIVECVDGPSHHAESEMDQRDCQKLVGEGQGHGYRCLSVVRAAIGLHVLLDF